MDQPASLPSVSAPVPAAGWAQALQGDLAVLRRRILGMERRPLLLSVGWILAGTAAFGLAAGSWRSGLQGLYSAIKLPALLLLTALGNAVLNGWLAPLLGLPLGIRESIRAVLLSFGLAATVLASFTPLLVFLVANLPLPTPGSDSAQAGFATLQISVVAAVAIAGLAAHLRLFQFLRSVGGPGPARRLLVAWLGTNLLLGGQLGWIARPFFGQPDLPVRFLRPRALEGNFLETLAHNASRLGRPPAPMQPPVSPP